MIRQALFSIILIYTFAHGALSFAVDETFPGQAFQEGVDAYGKGDFQKAHNSFLQCINSPQFRNPCLYNLGNSAYRLGKLGEALARYRQVLTTNPFDKQTRANYSMTKNSLKIKSIPGAVSSYETFRSTFLFPISFDLVLGGLCLASIAFVLGFLNFAKSRKAAEDAEEVVRPPLILWLSSAAVVLFVAWTTLKLYDSTFTRATIVQPKVDVRSGPTATAPNLFEIPEGLEVYVLERKDEWIQVSYPSGLAGWLPSDALVVTNEDSRW